MTPEEVAALSDDQLLDAIYVWVVTAHENMNAVGEYEGSKIQEKYRRHLEHAQQTLELLRAEALRRMDNLDSKG